MQVVKADVLPYELAAVLVEGLIKVPPLLLHAPFFRRPHTHLQQPSSFWHLSIPAGFQIIIACLLEAKGIELCT